jgi:hypothetical protein
MEEKTTEYDKYQLMWEALKGILIGKFNNTQDIIYLDILEIMQKFEKVE